MSLIGSLVKNAVELRSRVKLPKPARTPFEQQRTQLRKLLTKARSTEFGRRYDFDRVLEAFGQRDRKAFYNQYVRNVPTTDYNGIFKRWWHRTLKGEADITWPGVVRYFALSSGTSEASTKHIPITRDILKSNQKTATRQIWTLPDYDLPHSAFEGRVLLLGGSTDLTNKGHFYEGDLSGIQASVIPMWFQQFYKPGRKISTISNWGEKLEEITLKAKDWNISIIGGVPAWVQMLMEKIVNHYGVKTIHDIWPNLTIYVHGGVSFEPYRKSFDKLLAKPLVYMETYLASEGFLAFQYKPGADMKLVLDNGIFFEFVPFTDENFDSDGEMVNNPTTLMIDQVKPGVDYALLLSTNAGTWRYLIGDTIRFTNVDDASIVITGRTKHYISLCGEHLSVDNMNRAVKLASETFNVAISEFAVAGSSVGSLFAHDWYLGADQVEGLDAEALMQAIDNHLKQLNDDYRVERAGPLAQVRATVLPTEAFYDFMKLIGKEGGQNKFPRVLKKRQLEQWNQYLAGLTQK